MRFLEAKQQEVKTEENKMQPGSRPDQKKKPKESTSAHNSLGLKKEVLVLADSLGVDPTKLTGTGANGEVSLKDVRNAKSAADAASKPSTGTGTGSAINETE